MTEGEIHGVIRGLYEGILEPEAWQRSLHVLREISDSAQAAMVVLDKVHQRFSVSEFANPIDGLLEAYHQTYQAIDPGHAFAPQINVGDWYVDTRDLGTDAMARHDFYGEFLRGFGLGSVMACLVARHPSYEVYFSLVRPADRPMFTPDDGRKLDWAIPHMRQAMALRERTAELTALQHLSTQVLDRLNFGVIACAADGRALMHNTRGGQWVRRVLPSATSRDSGWTLSRPFGAMLEAACRPEQPVPAQAAMAQSREGDRAGIVVLPLPPSHALAASWQQPMALVAIHEKRPTPALFGQILRELYGLTPAETRLANLLLAGTGLPEACERLGIGRETSRTQLKSIFVKTGTGGQAQLSHLLTGLTACLHKADPGSGV
ncbi:DNA-binding CsgD family transcriptional regulator [Cupriavidus gilardii J11]|uniref:DNA-binding CsgD family transcriptional regulator n=1 Tax=Cupriavidus gilardii J11 TaxID=936133 RepID=A0A562BGK7_9BURK|nr:helix-turn-helix transcriptional regulator [Cupriavidus gilardii]TWG84262.1 DNA-binding CsgD family transcriptional regulator [Cupriavidus gilardii J11]